MPGINPLTAILFGLSGLVILAEQKQKFKNLVVALSIGIIFVALIRIIGEVAPSFRIDYILFNATNFANGKPIPMASVSLTTALAFSIYSYAALIICSEIKKKHSFALLCYLVVVILGATGVLAYWIPQIKTYFPILNGLAVHTASIFFISATISALAEVKRIWPNFAKFASKIALLFLTLLLPILISITAWRIALDSADNKLESIFEAETNTIKNDILSTGSVYISLLQGAKGFISASEFVSRDEWRTYVGSLDLAENYPGVQGVGYATFVKPADLNSHIKTIRADGIKDYRVWPEGKRDIYTSIIYLEPFDEKNSKAIGFDMFSEKTRRTAMSEAIDDNEPKMSGRVSLVQDSGGEPQPGFLIYVPVYENGKPHETIAERRANIKGFVYSLFRINDFIDAVFLKKSGNIDFQIFDGIRVDQENLTYKGDAYDVTSKKDFTPRYSKIETIYVAGQPWTIRYISLEDFNLSLTERILPQLIIIIGTIFSILFFLTFVSLFYSRSRAVEYAKRLTVDLLQSKRKIAKEKARDEAMLKGIGEGLIATDERGNIVFTNKAFTQILGFKAQEVKGKQMVKKIKMFSKDGKLITQPNRLITESLTSGLLVTTSKDKIAYYETADGRKIPVAITVTPIILKNKTVGAIEVFRDISQEIEIDQAKSEFVSLASHQLRTPLTAIKWYTEMVVNGDVGKLNSVQKEYLQEIASGNQLMIDLVNSLLNVSRLDLGTFIVRPETTNVTETINSVLRELRPQAVKQKIKIALKDSGKFEEYQADKKLLRIIFQNLLSNAIKYNKKGGKITISLDSVTKGSSFGGRKVKKDSMAFSVSDCGLGIPSRQKNQIFKKLFRADNVRETAVEGTGLGLYIIKAIIDKSGGEIWFKSEENKGTTFYFILPIKGMRKKAGKKSISY